MKLISILFSTPMVQAILSGNKSMTRRAMKLQPGEGEGYEAMGEIEFAYISKGGISGPYKCPYGQPGDVLWVRETFGVWQDITLHKAQKFNTSNWYTTEGVKIPYDTLKWKPNIHMPFDICRIFLRVKEIRVERLQNISEEDAIREGITKSRPIPMGWMNYMNPALYFKVDKEYLGTSAAAASFFSLWASINGEESYNSNPWVWVIAFERITDGNEIADIRKQWNERRAK